MRRVSGRSIVALAVPLLLSACAGKRIRQENAVALAVADGRVLEGCYDCLIEARGTYERLAQSTYMQRDTIALRLFETSLLLLIREKELALDWRASEERVRQLASSVPATVDAQRLMRIADAVLPDMTGRSADWPVKSGQTLLPFESVPAEVAWLATSPLRPVVRDYLALALDCSYDARVLAPQAQRGTTQRRPVLPPDAPPAITYRTGICMGPEPAMLAAALALVPRFHEAAYFAGSRAALQAEDDGGATATPLLTQAYDRFPRAIGISFMLGWVAEAVGECSEAVRRWDTVLVMDRTHEYAWLKRTICLSRLRRDSDAIASATSLLDLRTPSTKEAYYWRAVSHYRLKDLAAARSDIEAAKALGRNVNNLTMAGIIENDQNELPIAEQDLREARARPGGDENCTAAWTLALVIGKGSRPTEAAPMFESAMRCYEMKAFLAGHRITLLRSQPTSNPTYVARRIAALEADSTDQRTRYYAAAFNASGHTANAGNKARALELLDIAARDAKLTTQVAEMRKAILSIR